jgi:hypothetical protein
VHVSIFSGCEDIVYRLKPPCGRRASRACLVSSRPRCSRRWRHIQAKGGSSIEELATACKVVIAATGSPEQRAEKVVEAVRKQL